MPASAASSRYVVLDELGRGGMGRVVRAYDPKLRREVALKEVIRRDDLHEDATDRLVAEARAMAQLSDPHVVAVYDVEELDNGDVLMVMEYVRGRTLRDWLSTAQRDWREIIERFIEAGRGLAAAHGHDLLHRDFKPTNVLVSDGGTAKVMDFGLVKPASTNAVFESADGSDSTLTEAGTAMGTPRYMAPEQHRAEELTAAADQYAFCVALWEALCGSPPFAGKRMGHDKAAGVPAWPQRSTPRYIANAITRGLSPDPGDRWPSMTALLAVLARDRAGQRRKAVRVLGGVGLVGAVVFASVTWGPVEAKSCSGARAKLAGIWDETRQGELEVAFAAVDKSYADESWRRTKRALDAYADEWTAMETEACEATVVRGEQDTDTMDLRMACLHRAGTNLRAVVDVLADADADVVQKAHEVIGGLPSVSRCADVEALRADVEPPSDEEAPTVERVRDLLAQARVLEDAGRYDAAHDAVDDAKSLAEELGYGPLQTEIALREGSTLDALGRYQDAEASMTTALLSAARWRQWESMRVAARSLIYTVGYQQRRFDDALAHRPFAEALARGDAQAEGDWLGSLASVLTAEGRFDEAEVVHRQAIQRLTSALGADHPRVAVARNNLAACLDSLGRYAESEVEYRAAFEVRERNLGPDHPGLALERNNLANVLAQQGRNAEAETEHRAALELRLTALGETHPYVGISRANLATVLQSQGRYAEAESQSRAALAAWEASLGPDHPNIAAARANIGLALHSQGRYAEAEDQHRKSLAISRQALGPDHPSVATGHGNLGLPLQGQGRYREAEVEYRAALQGLRAALGPDHPRVAQSHNNLADALARQGKHAEAEAELRAALAGWRAALDADHPYVAMAQSGLADALRAQGKFDEALPLAEQAWTRRKRDDTVVEYRGETAFVLARILWSVKGTARDRARAAELARDAADSFRKAGDAAAQRAEEVDAWLDSPKKD